jgi:hypothetical protein
MNASLPSLLDGAVMLSRMQTRIIKLVFYDPTVSE